VFRVDVEQCARCGGPMRWVEAATGAETISRLLAKHGLAPRPPPTSRTPPSSEAQFRVPALVSLASLSIAGRHEHPGPMLVFIVSTAYGRHRFRAIPGVGEILLAVDNVLFGMTALFATDAQGHVTLTLGPPLFDEEGFTLPTISVARIADQPSSHHQHALRSARDLRTLPSFSKPSACAAVRMVCVSPTGAGSCELNEPGCAAAPSSSRRPGCRAAPTGCARAVPRRPP
jgi:hypothetical protein